jgi:hypothetical protein
VPISWPWCKRVAGVQQMQSVEAVARASWSIHAVVLGDDHGFGGVNVHSAVRVPALVILRGVCVTPPCTLINRHAAHGSDRMLILQRSSVLIQIKS